MIGGMAYVWFSCQNLTHNKPVPVDFSHLGDGFICVPIPGFVLCCIIRKGSML